MLGETHLRGDARRRIKLIVIAAGLLAPVCVIAVVICPQRGRLFEGGIPLARLTRWPAQRKAASRTDSVLLHTERRVLVHLLLDQRLQPAGGKRNNMVGTNKLGRRQ